MNEGFELITGVFPGLIKKGLFKKQRFMIFSTTRRIALLPLEAMMEKGEEEPKEELPEEINGIPVMREEDIDRLLSEDQPLIVEVSSENLDDMIANLGGISISLNEISKATLNIQERLLTISHREGTIKIYVEGEEETLYELNEQLKTLLNAKYVGID